MKKEDARVGMRVEHVKFGTARITAIGEYRIEVYFDCKRPDRTRKYYADFNLLKRVGNEVL